jgi:Flp pilus assembly protein TadD
LAEGQTSGALADLRQVARVSAEDWQGQLLYGQALLRAGYPVPARAALRRAMLLAPSSPVSWQALALAARVGRDPQAEMVALAGLQRVVPGEPATMARLSELYRHLGQSASAAKLEAAWLATLPPWRMSAQYLYRQRKATCEELQQLNREQPRTAAILAALATAEWEAGRREAALEALGQLLVLTPQEPAVVSSYAHACLLRGRVSQALTVLATAAGLGEVALDRALALWSLAEGHYAQALPPLQRLLARTPTDELLNRQLGIAAMQSGDQGLALKAYKLAWERAHSHLAGQLYAHALVQSARLPEAEAVLKQAYSHAPTESMLALMLTLVYRSSERMALAADLTADLARTRPEAVELLWLAGERYVRAGYVGRAHMLACKLRDDFAGDAIAMHAAVDLFRQLGIPSEARLVLTRFLGPQAKAPVPTADLLLEIAHYAADDNRLIEAGTAIKELIKRYPASRDAYAYQGLLLEQQGEWTEVVRHYTAALERWRADPEFTLALARAAGQTGNYTLAQRTFQQATALMPTATPWLELGELYQLRGDDTRARECWELAQERPGGAIRARVLLLNNYERTDARTKAAELLTSTVHLLETERALRRTRWRTALETQGLTPSIEELDALLLLAPDLTDPAPLQARLASLTAP